MYQNVLLILSFLITFSTSILCIKSNVSGIILYLIPVVLVFLAYLFKSRRFIFTCLSILYCLILSNSIIHNVLLILLCVLMIVILIFSAGYYVSEGLNSKRANELQDEIMHSRAMMIKCFKATVDIEKKGLTIAEFELLRELCVYRLNNKELGIIFDKSESTIKNQLKSIMNKVGADTRFQLIEMCRLNFI